jgi:hypothetical protein
MLKLDIMGNAIYFNELNGIQLTSLFFASLKPQPF